MFPTELPAELKLRFVSYLPLSALSKLLRVNHDWYDFIDGNKMNRDTIYREAAFLEGYTPSPTLAFEKVVGGQQLEPKTVLYSRRAMEGVSSWKEFCKRRKVIGRAWAGNAPSRVVPSPLALPSLGGTQRQESTPHSPHYSRVLRFKVDEKVGITMSTTELGGLIVRDLETDAVLWELPVWYVRGYSHLEYGEGFMIFERNDGNKEVWRRTADILVPSPTTSLAASSQLNPQTEPEPKLDPASSPDRRQLEVMNFVSHLTSSGSAVPRVSPSPTKPSSLKACFTPHAVLHTPEPSSAFRFVYPELLVVSLERAFVWDVRTGKILETLEGIQVIRPDMHGDEGGNHDLPDPFPLFLGRVRYADISPRHVFLAGGNLLRIFSRETKECVLDIPSTKLRYGRWKWGVASRALSIGSGIGQARQGTPVNRSEEKDSYMVARENGREVVRMPTTFSSKEYSSGINKTRLIDQFTAVHVSNDGKHLVALLEGSRLVIIHHFEAVLAECRSPPPNLQLSSTSNSDSQQILQNKKSKMKPSAARRRRERQVQLKTDEQRNQERYERQEEKFNNVLDVQLGSPFASSSIYLAYEDGKIGVVTSNAVYIVVPTIPSSPANKFSKPPELSILRIPYFANPAWLGQVSCLMMSDTGLYLNWNPTWPQREQLTRSQGAGQSANLGAALDFEPRNKKERERRERMMAGWERDYEHDLIGSDSIGYQSLPNGDMFVTPVIRDLEDSDVSTIYRVDFAPIPSSSISTPHASVSASQRVIAGGGALFPAGSTTAEAGSQSRKRKGKAKKGRK